MIVREIIEELEKIYPSDAAEGWDNSGLQVGRGEKEVQTVFLALDLTEEIMEEAVKAGADLIITHHPLLMGGIKKITTDDFHGRKVIRLIREDISHYAMHTNFDVITMGNLAGERLGLSEREVLVPTKSMENGKTAGYGSVGNLKKQTVREVAETLKTKFQLDSVRVFGETEAKVSRVAILPGSGKDFVKEAIQSGAEVYISGDFGHHHGMDAVEEGIIILDAGHYGLEHIFVAYMKELLEEKFPELTIKTAKNKHPFEVL